MNSEELISNTIRQLRDRGVQISDSDEDLNFVLMTHKNDSVDFYIDYQSKILKDIRKFYYFDVELRAHVLKALGLIEDAIRSTINFYLMSRYGMSWYTNNNILDKKTIEEIREKKFKVPQTNAQYPTLGTGIMKLEISVWPKIFDKLKGEEKKILQNLWEAIVK